MAQQVPNLSAAYRNFRPRWVGVKELNLNDEWRAVWVDSDSIPVEAPVVYAYAVVAAEGKGYVTRPVAAAKYGIVETLVELGDDPAKAARDAALAQVGATAATVELMGYFECKATQFNKEYEPGTATVRPIYLIEAKKVRDIGKESGFERRRLPLNEFAVALRNRYPEMLDPLNKTVDLYTVRHVKAAR
jgi:hypothetical protein